MLTPHDFSLPWWYRLASWLPLFVGFSSSLLMLLTLTGYVTVPDALSTLKWLPVIYNSLEGAGRVFGLMSGSLIAGLSSWFISATFIQAWILYPKANQIAENKKYIFDSLTNNSTNLKIENEELKKELLIANRENKEIFDNFSKGFNSITNDLNRLIEESNIASKEPSIEDESEMRLPSSPHPTPSYRR